MSTNDRGAFGQLLTEAKAGGAQRLRFEVNLHADDESDDRWRIECSFDESGYVAAGFGRPASGRTGEEALRRFVEGLRK